MKFNIILAVDDNNWIWKDWDLAWRIPGDMKYFKNTTSNTKDLSKHNAVIMWRKTRDSIPSKYRPLPDRINCVLSRSIKAENINSKIDNFVLYFSSLDNCIKELSQKDNLEDIFIIWWANLYNQVLNDKRLDKIYLTRVLWEHDCDVFFDWIPNNFSMISETRQFEDKWIKYKFQIYKREA